METKLVALDISKADISVRLKAQALDKLWRALAKYIDLFSKKEEFDSVTTDTKVKVQRQLLANLTAFLKTRAQEV